MSTPALCLPLSTIGALRGDTGAPAIGAPPAKASRRFVLPKPSSALKPPKLSRVREGRFRSGKALGGLVHLPSTVGTWHHSSAMASISAAAFHVPSAHADVRLRW